MPVLNGTATSGERVTATLRSSASPGILGTATTYAESNAWSLTLAGCTTYQYWTLSIGSDGVPNRHYTIVMPSVGGPYTIADVAANVPAAPASTTPPTRSELDTRLTAVEDYVDTVPDLLAGVKGQIFDLEAGYGLISASGDPIHFTSAANASSGQAWFVEQWIPAGKAITNLWVGVKTAGTYDGSSTPNHLGIYSAAGVSLGATADDPNLWTSAGWHGGAIVGGPIAAQASGRMVYVSVLVRGATVAPVLCFCASPGDAVPVYTGPSMTARRCFYTYGATALPSSINPASTGTATGYVPLLGVS